MAVEPPATPWALPRASDGGDDDLLGVGADLAPGTILAAYRRGLFPMPVRKGVLGWWSPEPRGIVPLDELRISRSLRRSCRRYDVRIDTHVEEVIAACAEPNRPHGWITPEVQEAYGALHDLGWVHSVETWTSDGRLVGGLYGVAVGGLFAGESMFHRAADASKVALVALVDALDGEPGRLLDVQWVTPHLRSLGAVEIRRDEYLARLEVALDLPLPSAFDGTTPISPRDSESSGAGE